MDKKDLLNNLIQDTQESSKFIESKTAIITAIIGAILIYYLDNAQSIIKNYFSFSCFNHFFLIMTLLLFIVNIYWLFKIVFPLDNPISKLPEKYNGYPNLYLSKKHLNKENPNIEDFENLINDESSLEKAMELEYAKTSFIRNNKLHYYKLLVIGILLQVCLFVIHLIIYNQELIKTTTE